jgi:hypothetical protein
MLAYQVVVDEAVLELHSSNTIMRNNGAAAAWQQTQ